MRNICFSLALLQFVPLAAWPWQDGEEQPQTAADVRLVLSVRGDRSTFRIGEVIPLELAFTSSSPKKYQIDKATYDRSGRLGLETWAIQPDGGFDDPLAIYFGSFSAFIGGGLRGFEVLSDKPVVIQAELNEWVRFKQAGRYRVTATSGRVSRLDSSRWRGVSVTSNEVELTIIPASAAWQERTLEHALAGLDGPKQADAYRDATKLLRYLGSEAAAREIARRMRGPDESSEFMFGLVGSPAKDAGLDEMQDLLASAGFPVTNLFLRTMSVLAVTPGGSDPPAQREALEARFRQDLIAAMGAKQGEALAISANSIVEEAAMRSQELPADVKCKLSEALVAGFDHLPPRMQHNLIEYRWRALDHEAMLPLLRKVAQRYQDFPQLREMNAFESNNASGAALRYWYEIDPAGARPAVLQEITRPKPRFNGEVLGMLPDRELPETDRPLIEHLQECDDFDGMGNLASLIHRYASAAIEPEVTGYLDENSGKLACAAVEPLLAYLVKHDPESARPRLAAAMAAREHTGCYHFLLAEVGRLESGPVLEQAAIKALDDSDPEVVETAATYLGEHGSAAAEDVLWTHLSAWSRQWMGREAEFRLVPGGDMAGVNQAGAETNMIQALATGMGWIRSDAKLRRLLELSVGPQQRQQVENYTREWQSRPWRIQFIGLPAGKFQIHIVDYQCASLEAAENKLKQFPRGTAFDWWPSRQDGEEKAMQELSKFAAEHGIDVIKKTQ
jgi:hypothetical protein